MHPCICASCECLLHAVLQKHKTSCSCALSSLWPPYASLCLLKHPSACHGLIQECQRLTCIPLCARHACSQRVHAYPLTRYCIMSVPLALIGILNAAVRLKSIAGCQPPSASGFPGGPWPESSSTPCKGGRGLMGKVWAGRAVPVSKTAGARPCIGAHTHTHTHTHTHRHRQ